MRITPMESLTAIMGRLPVIKERGLIMKKTALLALVSVAMTLPVLAQNKVDNRLGESAEVLNQLILKPDSIPQAYLNKARCVLVFPAVKKVGVGSLGVQLGSSTTDYVLLVMTPTGAQKILSGKLKLGADATAVAGPTGAKAVGANDINADILTYSRAKGGLFAGASLGSASMASDNDANQKLFGKNVDVLQIVRDGAVTTPPAAQPLVDLLQKTSPHRQH